MKKDNKKKGMSLIEIVIGLSIIFVSFFSVVTAYNFFVSVAVKNAEITKANYLMEEGVEVVRFLRDTSWSNFSSLATSTDYYLVFDSEGWKATTTPILIDNFFERKFVVDDVYRDAMQDISDTGVLDEETKKVDVSVSMFVAGTTTTQSATVYLTNLFD